MEEQFIPIKNELASLTLKDLFYKYVRFLPLFILCISLSLFAAYLYLRYATLVYKTTGTMIVQDDKSGGSNDKFEQIFESDNKKNIQNEIEYLQSRQIMSRVVKTLNLNYTFLAQGNIKELNIYKASPFTIETFKIEDSSAGFTLQIDFENDNSFRVNKSAQIFTFGQVFKNEYGVFKLVRNSGGVGQQYKIVWSPTNSVAGGLASSLVVAPKQNTGILVLTLESTNAQLAADVINALMEEYKKTTIDDKNATTLQRLLFIDKELNIVAGQLDSITNLRLEFIKKHNLFAAETQSANYLAQIEAAKEAAKQQRIHLNNAYQIESYLKQNNNSVPVPSTLGLEDPTLNVMVESYNKAQLEKQSLLENARPGNVAVRHQEEIVDQLRQNIMESLRNIKANYNSIIGSLQGFSGTAQSQIRLLPEKQQALTEIERQAQSKLVIYNSLLEKREESAIALASTISNIKVLQDATPNSTPVKPNRRNTQLLAIFVGLALPALFIFILELLNDKVTTRYDIERITDTPILGEIGHSYGKNTLVVTSNNRGVVAEQFRIIRSNLQYILNNLQKPVILVTSSFSGEGKSFVSTNIGGVMALANKKTIILEFDIRKPKILSHLNISKKGGLTNYLLGKASLESLPIQVEGIENLYVLSSGPVPPNPAELLLDTKLKDLFDYLRQNFDVVVMDTAPVGMVSDAMTLSKFADSTLYIVRQGHTYKKQIAMIDEFHREGKLPKISIILNDVKLQTGYGYYGYGRYGYGHGYGSGYFEDDAPPNTFMRKWFGWLDTKSWNKKKRNRTKV